ncbi:MAG: hypothetical protein EOO24_12470, partial [Comamonadaceae bacterium]
VLVAARLGIPTNSAIVNRSGRTIAAINISGQANRTPPRQMQEAMLPQLREAAREISKRLGAAG